MLNETELKGLIENKFPDQYNKAAMEGTIQDIKEMNPDIQRRSLKFLETGEIEESEIEGYTIKQLTEMGMNPLAAFLGQDWLLKKPGEAKRAMKRGRDSAVPRGKPF